MDISSYASNVQPYGSPSGTNVAKDNGVSAASVSDPNGPSSSDGAKGTDHDFSVRAVMELAEKRQQLNREERDKLVEQMNDFVASMNKGVSFRVDEESGRDVVTIYEANTGDVIRQIPDEEMLVILRRLAEHSANSGLLAEKV